MTIHGNGATLQRDATVGTPQFRLIRTGVFPDNVRVTISDLTFANGDAGLANGGAILLQAGDLSLARCIFTNNRADTGGAVYATTTTIPNRFLSVVDSTFTGNAATGLNNGGKGGAVYMLGTSDVTLQRDTFTLNTAFREGGALRVQTSSATVTISDSLIANNTANGGAGIFVQGPTTITNTVVRDNLSGGTGGGIWVQGGSLNLTAGVVSGNRVTGTTASGGGIFSQANTTITDSTVRDNTTGNSGGGIYVQATLNLSGSTVSGNRAESTVGTGGGVSCQGPMTILNSTIHNNRAGGGIGYFGGSTDIATITHSTITDNRVFWARGLRRRGVGRRVADVQPRPHDHRRQRAGANGDRRKRPGPQGHRQLARLQPDSEYVGGDAQRRHDRQRHRRAGRAGAAAGQRRADVHPAAFAGQRRPERRRPGVRAAAGDRPARPAAGAERPHRHRRRRARPPPRPSPPSRSTAAPPSGRWCGRSW